MENGNVLSSSPTAASFCWFRPMRRMLRPDLASCLENSSPMSPVGPEMAGRGTCRSAQRQRPQAQEAAERRRTSPSSLASTVLLELEGVETSASATLFTGDLEGRRWTDALARDDGELCDEPDQVKQERDEDGSSNGGCQSREI